MGCPCKLDRCQTRLAKIINTVVPRYRECQVLVAGDSKLSGIVTKRLWQKDLPGEIRPGAYSNYWKTRALPGGEERLSPPPKGTYA